MIKLTVTILIGLLLIIAFPQTQDDSSKQIYYGKLTGRIIEWKWPATDWSWERKFFIGSDEYGWRDLTEDCDWYSTKVKVKCAFMLGHGFKIELKKPTYKRRKHGRP